MNLSIFRKFSFTLSSLLPSRKNISLTSARARIRKDSDSFSLRNLFGRSVEHPPYKASHIELLVALEKNRAKYASAKATSAINNKPNSLDQGRLQKLEKRYNISLLQYKSKISNYDDENLLLTAIKEAENKLKWSATEKLKTL